MPSVFCFFRRTPQRQKAIAINSDMPEKSYLLYGADKFHEYGWQMDCNLFHPPSQRLDTMGMLLSNLMFRLKGYGGDFATVIGNLKYASRADVVLSTVDTVGIPLALFRYLGILKKPLIYASIGLDERLNNMGPSFLKNVQMRSLSSCSALIGYGFEEIKQLQDKFGVKQKCKFIPFGVDYKNLKPNRKYLCEQVDVLSAGMDIHRDFKQLEVFARRNPLRTVKIITNKEHWAQIDQGLKNITLAEPLSFQNFLQELVSAKVIALPVKENSYSGATTLLLQSMALGKPVVVTRTGAISEGYGFIDNKHLCFSEPGSPDSLAGKIESLLGNKKIANKIGEAGKNNIQANHSWERYIQDLARVLNSAY